MNKKRTLQDFLKWCEENDISVSHCDGPKIYNFFNPPQSEDVKERANNLAAEIAMHHAAIHGLNSAAELHLASNIKCALLSFQAPTTSGQEVRVAIDQAINYLEEYAVQDSVVWANTYDKLQKALALLSNEEGTK